MGRIDADFQGLQPIALPHALEGKDVTGGGAKAIELGKRRRLAVSHIGKYDAVLLDHRIGSRLDPLIGVGINRFTRLFQALAVCSVQPAMKRASEAAVFQPPIAQIGAPVRTLTIDQSELPAVASKQNQVLAHQANRNDRPVPVELNTEGGGRPILAQDFPGPGPGTGQSQ